MRVLDIFLLPLILLVAGGCATSPGSKPGAGDPSTVHFEKPASPETQRARRDQMVGKWFGEADMKEGGRRWWLKDARRDGTFTIKFHSTMPDGKARDQVEAGIWGVSGNVYFTATREMWDGHAFREIDATDGTYYDAYEITAFDGQSMSYRNLDTGSEFRVKKVPASFTGP
jgi:hypothetical protein